MCASDRTTPIASLRSAPQGGEGSRDSRLRKLAGDRLTQAMGAVRNAVESRLFAAQADADNLADAARAEIKAAAALDTKFEFNRAALRGADLMLTLAEAAWTGALRV